MFIVDSWTGKVLLWQNHIKLIVHQITAYLYISKIEHQVQTLLILICRRYMYSFHCNNSPNEKSWNMTIQFFKKKIDKNVSKTYLNKTYIQKYDKFMNILNSITSLIHSMFSSYFFQLYIDWTNKGKLVIFFTTNIFGFLHFLKTKVHIGIYQITMQRYNSYHLIFLTSLTCFAIDHDSFSMYPIHIR